MRVPNPRIIRTLFRHETRALGGRRDLRGGPNTTLSQIILAENGDSILTEDSQNTIAQENG